MLMGWHWNKPDLQLRICLQKQGQACYIFSTFLMARATGLLTKLFNSEALHRSQVYFAQQVQPTELSAGSSQKHALTNTNKAGAPGEKKPSKLYIRSKSCYFQPGLWRQSYIGHAQWGRRHQKKKIQTHKWGKILSSSHLSHLKICQKNYEAGTFFQKIEDHWLGHPLGSTKKGSFYFQICTRFEELFM